MPSSLNTIEIDSGAVHSIFLYAGLQYSSTHIMYILCEIYKSRLS